MRGEVSYRWVLANVLETGAWRPDRTGTGTRALFAQTIEADLWGGRIPLLTAKRIPVKAVVGELLWFIQGSTTVRPLQDQGIHIWDAWAAPDGSLGPVYGKQWRDWDGIDQLANVLESIKSNPNSRRHIVSAWNVAELDQMALPPCPVMFQFLVNHQELTCVVTQRSGDLFLGVPFDLAEYALLTHAVAAHTGLTARRLVMNIGDAHIYQNHADQVRLYLSRTVDPRHPIVEVTASDLFSMTAADIRIDRYNPQPAIPAPVAV